MNKQLAFLATTVVFAIGLSGCTAITQEAEATPVLLATTPPVEAPRGDPAEESVDHTLVLPEAPPAGTSAAIAWEALMGPDGEYAASASYLAVLEKFGDVEPYASIQSAEDRHSDALIRQLTRLGVEVPDNPYLGSIPAPADLEAAAMAWAEGEVANIAMYDELLAQTDDAAIVRVLTNLRNASADSHLPAFEAAAANGGTLSVEQMANEPGGR